MISSRILKGDSIAETCAVWQPPTVEELAAHSPIPGVPVDLVELDPVALKQKAWEDGRSEGYANGIAAGAKEVARKARALDSVLQSLARPLDDIDHRVEEEIVALVTAVARQLVRREIRIDPTHVIGVVRDGLAALPSASAEVVVRVHPEDAELIQQELTPGHPDCAWRLEIDPLIQRGDCRIVSSVSEVDGRLDTRLGRTIASFFEAADGDDQRGGND